jgi:Zn-dependent peptidase ImmA (M78 family)
MTLPRGFKAKAERFSIQFRTELNLRDVDCLDAFELSKHLNVVILCPSFFLGRNTKWENLCSSNSGWSAMALKNKYGDNLILHNTHHSPARQQSNIMHELAHIICGHEFDHIESSHEELFNLGLRVYNKNHEEEAETLGSTLQIPRSGLLKLLRNNSSREEVAKIYRASTQLVQLRINSTGAQKQIQRTQNFNRK